MRLECVQSVIGTFQYFDAVMLQEARPLWYKDDCLILGLNGVLLVQQNKWNCCSSSK